MPRLAKNLPSLFLILIALVGAGAARSADTLPSRLDDRQFWALSTDLSEASGSFKSDNLLSNELRFQTVIRDLQRIVRPGGVYLGVGPEQNFTYIAAIRPRLAFIVDVRRGNADLHLMYKALFELASDRADFVSRLFARPRPAGLDAASTAAEIFNRYATAHADDRLADDTLAAIRHQLVDVHGFPMTDDDLQRIESIYRVFLLAGPKIRYSPYGSFGGTIQPTYADLMTATDDIGEPRAYLASEAAFDWMRDFERRNALVPVVGNFAGAKTLRAVGDYVRRRGGSISVFYVSNVEEYLRENQSWQAFCANAAQLPIDEASVFIRTVRATIPEPPGTGFLSRLDYMHTDVTACRAD